MDVMRFSNDIVRARREPRNSRKKAGSLLSRTHTHTLSLFLVNVLFPAAGGGPWRQHGRALLLLSPPSRSLVRSVFRSLPLLLSSPYGGGRLDSSTFC